VWIGATIWFVAAEGLPLTRDWIAAWIVLGLLAFSLGDLRGWFRGVVLEWLPFFGILACYTCCAAPPTGCCGRPSTCRRSTSTSSSSSDRCRPSGCRTASTRPHAAVVRGARVARLHVALLRDAAVAGVLWKIDRALPPLRRQRRRARAAGFATYALFPAAPPGWRPSRG